MRLTDAQIEAGRSPAGGWTRKQLATWGVPWPPPKGWRKKLTEQPEPNLIIRGKVRWKLKDKASDFPNIPLVKFYFRRPYSATLDRVC
jgi:hypothetical protein